MKFNTFHKKTIVDVISLLLILLFVYAAASKLLDFQNFRVQLGQSPLLSAFAFWVSILVPTIELITVVLLIMPQYRSIGLFLSLLLMVMFTAYIFIVLYFSSFVPCSCGGILEKMSWDVHLIFNAVFVVLAFTALIISQKVSFYNSASLFTMRSIMFSAFISAGTVVVLFYTSEEIIHYKNPFVRRYIKQSVELAYTKDLKYNSYYFSGHDDKNIYLGNYTTPLKIISIDSSLQFSRTIKIDFKDDNIPFRFAKTVVKGNHFYLEDGRVPCVYFGSVANWKITGQFADVPNFTSFQLMGDSNFVFRNNTGINWANVLGVYSNNQAVKVQYYPQLLQKQLDGIFDTDGVLLYNEKLKNIVFVYYYRNEFIIADQIGQLIRRGNTIDTISKAKIKVAYLKDGRQRKMAAPPLVVNPLSATCNNLLFVESRVKGQYEREKMWKHAAIIDVYNLKNKSYVLSFPIFGTEEHKLSAMLITNTYLYVIIDTKLTAYRLKGILRNEMKK